MKCRASHELIYAQISWATAGAERSRAEGNRNARTPVKTDDGSTEPTVEEQLLAAILEANGRLTEVLKAYEDLHRVYQEQQVEERSRAEVRRPTVNPDSSF
jgi:hypothetical protein